MIKTIEVGFSGGKGVDAIIRAMDLCAVKKHLMNAPEFERSLPLRGHIVDN